MPSGYMVRSLPKEIDFEGLGNINQTGLHQMLRGRKEKHPGRPRKLG